MLNESWVTEAIQLKTVNLTQSDLFSYSDHSSSGNLHSSRSGWFWSTWAILHFCFLTLSLFKSQPIATIAAVKKLIKYEV